jgi:hypothetical protein
MRQSSAVRRTKITKQDALRWGEAIGNATLHNIKMKSLHSFVQKHLKCGFNLIGGTCYSTCP